MSYLMTVADLQEVQSELIHIFPDSTRASETKSMWFKGRKVLVLTCTFYVDTVYAYIVHAKGGLLYFIDYDSNSGNTYQFAESSVDEFVKRMLVRFYGEVHKN